MSPTHTLSVPELIEALRIARILQSLSIIHREYLAELELEAKSRNLKL